MSRRRLRPAPPGARARRQLVRVAALAALAAVVSLAALAAWPARQVGRPSATSRPPVAPEPRAAPAHLSAELSPSRPLDVLGQSSWVRPGGTFDLRLAVEPASASVLQVAIYPSLSARTTFDQDAAGAPSDSPVYVQTVTLAAGSASGADRLDLRLPVDAPSVGTDLATFAPGPSSAVFPIRLQLFDAAGTPVGQGLSSFVVVDGGLAGFDRLDVAVVVPVGAPPALQPDGTPAALGSAASARVNGLVSLLSATASVPVSLEVTPETADALRAGAGRGAATLGRLTALLRSGDELLPSPYVSTSLAGLDAAGLPGQVVAQLAAGRSALADDLGVTPSPATWVFSGGLDEADLVALDRVGLTHLVVPGADLSPLPADLQVTTYGRPAVLSGPTGASASVLSADHELSTRVGVSGDPVLAAEQDLAELAMIQLETPSLPRGVAVVPPAGVSQTWLSTLLGGLGTDPFVVPMTLGTLFDRLPAEPVAAGGPSRSLVGDAPPLPGAAAVGSVDGQVRMLARLAPNDDRALDAARQDLLVAESSQLSGQQQSAVLAAARRVVRSVTLEVSLPLASSVTLTSRQASLPVTVDSDPSVALHLTVVLRSSALAFHGFDPAGGTCRSEQAGLVEVCNLVVHAASVTLRVPVSTRTSGVFPLQVQVTPAGGGVPLATARVTVRSTAVSSVGLVLIVAALVFLAVWWYRDIRHGRRASRLVTPPEDGPDDGPGGGDGGGGQPGPGRRSPDPADGPSLEADPVGTWLLAPSPARPGTRVPEMSPSERPPGPSRY